MAIAQTTASRRGRRRTNERWPDEGIPPRPSPAAVAVRGRLRAHTRPAVVTAALIVAAALMAAGCGSDGQSQTRTSPDPPPAAAAATWLKGICPDPISVQTPWYPQAELGGLYQLLGPERRTDSARKRVSGKLVARGVDTGVRLELRAGGPAIGPAPMTTHMYLDTGITLGMPPLDEQIQVSAQRPTLAVVAPLEKDPVAIGWDPDAHPEATTIADIGRSGIPVVSYPSAFTDYLISSRQLQPGQVEESYDGSPARYVASDVAVTPFATNEPYTFAHEITPSKPMRVQLVHDAGYPNYRNLLAIRAADKDALAPCLTKLVPIIQQAQVDFITHPAATIDLLVKLNRDYHSGFVYSRGNAEYSVRRMKELAIVGNGTDPVLGNFDQARVQRLITITRPILTTRSNAVKVDLSPPDLVTNEFIETTIGLRP